MRLAALIPKPNPTSPTKRDRRNRPFDGKISIGHGSANFGTNEHLRVGRSRSFDPTPWLLPKLDVADVNDPLEREADSVADSIMRMPKPDNEAAPQAELDADTEEAAEDLTESPIVTGFAGDPNLPSGLGMVARRKCAACEDEDEGAIHRALSAAAVMRKCQTCEDEDEIRRTCASCDIEGQEPIERERAGGLRGGPTSEGFADSVRGRIRSGGRPLPDLARRFLEPRIGVNLGDLRLHTDASADSLTKQINARAFTIGQDIFFRDGEFQPGKRDGMHLLAHEVAHTLQTRAPTPLARRTHSFPRLPPGIIWRAPADVDDPKAEEVVVLCARMLIRIRTPAGTSEYDLEGTCTAPAGEYLATVRVKGRSFHLRHVEAVTPDAEEATDSKRKQFSFKYKLDPEKRDPSRYFHDGQRVTVKVDPYQRKIDELLATEKWDAAIDISENYDVEELHELYETIDLKLRLEGKHRLNGGERSAHLRLLKRIGRQLAVAEAQQLRIDAGLAEEGDVSERAEDHAEVFQDLIALQTLYRRFFNNEIKNLEVPGSKDLRDRDADLYRLERDMVLHDDFDATSQSRWFDLVTKQLHGIRKIVSAAYGEDPDNPNVARVKEDLRDLQRRVEQLSGAKFLATGRRLAAVDDAEAHREEQIEQAVQVLKDHSKHWSPDKNFLDLSTKADEGVYAHVEIADLRSLPADIIAEALRRLQEQDSDAYNGALFGGQTILQLQDKGITGLTEFDSEGQDFMVGLAIGGGEYDATHPGQSPAFSMSEWGALLAGFLEGVVDGLLNGYAMALKLVLDDIFDAAFWDQIYELLVDEVPKFVGERTHRRELGVFLGELTSQKIDEVSSKEPGPYGMAIGRLFGHLVFEIIISILTGGALAAVAKTRPLRKLEAVVRLARMSGRSALVRRGASALLEAAEAVAKTTGRLRSSVRARLPALTSTGSFERELAQMSVRERRLAQAWERSAEAAKALEEAAKSAKADPKKVDELQAAMARAAEANRKLDVEIRVQDEIARGTHARDRERYGSADAGSPLSSDDLILNEAISPDRKLLDEIEADPANHGLGSTLHEARTGARSLEFPKNSLVDSPNSSPDLEDVLRRSGEKETANLSASELEAELEQLNHFLREHPDASDAIRVYPGSKHEYRPNDEFPGTWCRHSTQKTVCVTPGDEPTYARERRKKRLDQMTPEEAKLAVMGHPIVGFKTISKKTIINVEYELDSMEHVINLILQGKTDVFTKVSPQDVARLERELERLKEGIAKIRRQTKDALSMSGAPGPEFLEKTENIFDDLAKLERQEKAIAGRKWAPPIVDTNAVGRRALDNQVDARFDGKMPGDRGTPTFGTASPTAAMSKYFSPEEFSSQVLSGTSDGHFVYVVTERGELRIAQRATGQHPRIIDGTDQVRAAGEFWLENGKISLIDTRSGHYMKSARRTAHNLDSIERQARRAFERAFGRSPNKLLADDYRFEFHMGNRSTR